MDFRRRALTESVAAFHHRDFTVGPRELWIPSLDERRTLVLGSSQREDSIDLERCARHGIEVVRRRTGGGAVLVSHADLIWFDLVIERTDPLWSDDVARAFEWVGQTVAATLHGFGVATEMHTGRQRTTPLSPHICFAGLGAGELTTNGRKVVGISQRRTRTHARFQVAVLRRWDGALHADLLDIPDQARGSVASELGSVAVGAHLDPVQFTERLMQHLPV